MKKLFITMLAAVAATASFAQNPKIDKEIAATKSYAAGLEIYNKEKDALTPELQQKAALALNKLATAEGQTAIENASQNKLTNADYPFIVNMINAADLCKKTEAKGFADIVKNIANFRPVMINAANSTNDNDEKLMYALAYVNTAEANDQFVPLASFFAAYADFNKGDFANAAKYARVAFDDERVKDQAEQIFRMSYEKTMKTREDSLKYIDVLKEIDIDKFFVQISSIYISMGMRDKVQSLVDEALAKNSQNKMAYYIRGTLNAENKDYNNAIADYKKVVEIDPDYVYGWDKLAVCYCAIGDDVDSKAPKKNGRLLGDDLKNYCEAYENAVAAYEHVRTLDPNHETINSWPRQLRVCYNNLGKKDKAAEISKIIGDE